MQLHSIQMLLRSIIVVLQVFNQMSSKSLSTLYENYYQIQIITTIEWEVYGLRRIPGSDNV